jgi:hypothetical protein
MGAGFRVAAVTRDGYALRRQIDWALLPGTFSSEDPRVAQRSGWYEAP